MFVPPGKSKYFIAIVPPSPVYEEALKWKTFFHQNFNSKAALRSPPHITLHMPFEWKTAKENLLVNSLNDFSRQCNPFQIEFQDFGSFPPRVIYLQVENNPSLFDLQLQLTQHCKTNLNLFNANRQEQPYHPHLTVAFRDLKKAVFPGAWDAVKDEKFQYAFLCENLSLLKHNGKIWEVQSSFSFTHL